MSEEFSTTKSQFVWVKKEDEGDEKAEEFSVQAGATKLSNRDKVGTAHTYEVRLKPITEPNEKSQQLFTQLNLKGDRAILGSAPVQPWQYNPGLWSLIVTALLARLFGPTTPVESTTESDQITLISGVRKRNTYK